MSIVKEYFEDVLSRMGYGDTEVYYSLGYCQGDGVAFYGEIDLERVARRILGPKRHIEAVLNVLADEGGKYGIERPRVQRIPGRGRYDHAFTMEIGGDLEFLDEDDVDSLTREAWAEFTEALLEDVQRISYRLERDGYALYEAFLTNEDEEQVLYERCVGNCRVRVRTRADEDAPSMFATARECEDFREVCFSLIQGELAVVSMVAEIFNLDDEDGGPLVDSSLYEVDIKIKDGKPVRQDFLPIARELVSEAAAALRPTDEKKAA